MTLFGVDLHSGYQASFDFRRAASEEYKFAFIKTSQGTRYVPGGFREYRKKAEDAGFTLGFYHFLEAGSSAHHQATHFLDVVYSNGGHRDRLLAVDFEDYGNLDPTNEQLEEFSKTVKHDTNGHALICYSTFGYWYEVGQPSGSAQRYDIDVMWEASVWSADERRLAPQAFYRDEWKPWYADKEHPHFAFSKQPTLFRQFTWGGAVGGLFVDTNAFEGSLDELRRLTK